MEGILESTYDALTDESDQEKFGAGLAALSFSATRVPITHRRPSAI